LAEQRHDLLVQYRYGNAGRNVLIGPPIVNLDASLTKDWVMRETHCLERRGEFFNLPNHPNFGQPGVSPGSATYGVVGATRIDSREVQLALKFVF
jgi:hypothetical protein